MRKGFSITEILIALAIFGIVATVAVPLYQEHNMRGRVTNVMVSVAGAKQAVEAHYVKTGELLSVSSYPVKNSTVIENIAINEGNITVKGIASQFNSSDFTLVFQANVGKDGLRFDCSAETGVEKALLPEDCAAGPPKAKADCDPGSYLVGGRCIICASPKEIVDGNCICKNNGLGDSCLLCEAGYSYHTEVNLAGQLVDSCKKDQVTVKVTEDDCNSKTAAAGESYTWDPASAKCRFCTNNKEFNLTKKFCECPANHFGENCDVTCAAGETYSVSESICTAACSAKGTFYLPPEKRVDSNQCALCDEDNASGQGVKLWFGAPNYKCCPEHSISYDTVANRCLCDASQDYFYNSATDSCDICRRTEHKEWNFGTNQCECIDKAYAYLDTSDDTCKCKWDSVMSGPRRDFNSSHICECVNNPPSVGYSYVNAISNVYYVKRSYSNYVSDITKKCLSAPYSGWAYTNNCLECRCASKALYNQTTCCSSGTDSEVDAGIEYVSGGCRCASTDREWNSSTAMCECKGKSVAIGTRLQGCQCTGGSVWNFSRTDCECPASLKYFDTLSETCVATCPAGTETNNSTNKCECTSGYLPKVLPDGTKTCCINYGYSYTSGCPSDPDETCFGFCCGWRTCGTPERPDYASSFSYSEPIPSGGYNNYCCKNPCTIARSTWYMNKPYSSGPGCDCLPNTIYSDEWKQCVGPQCIPCSHQSGGGVNCGPEANCESISSRAVWFGQTAYCCGVPGVDYLQGQNVQHITMETANKFLKCNTSEAGREIYTALGTKERFFYCCPPDRPNYTEPAYSSRPWIGGHSSDRNPPYDVYQYCGGCPGGTPYFDSTSKKCVATCPKGTVASGNKCSCDTNYSAYTLPDGAASCCRTYSVDKTACPTPAPCPGPCCDWEACGNQAEHFAVSILKNIEYENICCKNHCTQPRETWYVNKPFSSGPGCDCIPNTAYSEEWKQCVGPQCIPCSHQSGGGENCGPEANCESVGVLNVWFGRTAYCCGKPGVDYLQGKTTQHITTAKAKEFLRCPASDAGLEIYKALGTLEKFYYCCPSSRPRYVEPAYSSRPWIGGHSSDRNPPYDVYQYCYLCPGGTTYSAAAGACI